MTEEETPKKRNGPWKPGQSGNPAGRPKGSRNRLSEDFVTALAEDFEKNGREVIEVVRKNDPSVYLQVISKIVPKDINITTDVGAELIAALRILNASEPTVYAITGPEPEQPSPLRH